MFFLCDQYLFQDLNSSLPPSNVPFAVGTGSISFVSLQFMANNRFLPQTQGLVPPSPHSVNPGSATAYADGDKKPSETIHDLATPKSGCSPKVFRHNPIPETDTEANADHKRLWIHYLIIFSALVFASSSARCEWTLRRNLHRIKTFLIFLVVKRKTHQP